MLLVIVAGLAGLAPLAYASPPDQEWLAGVYDDGDHDDVVLAVYGASGIPNGGCPVLVGPLPSPRTFVLPSTSPPGSPELPGHRDRAPPA